MSRFAVLLLALVSVHGIAKVTIKDPPRPDPVTDPERSFCLGRMGCKDMIFHVHWIDRCNDQELQRILKCESWRLSEMAKANGFRILAEDAMKVRSRSSNLLRRNVHATNALLMGDILGELVKKYLGGNEIL